MENIHLILFLWSDTNMYTHSHTHKCAYTYTKHVHGPTHISGAAPDFPKMGLPTSNGGGGNLLFGLKYIWNISNTHTHTYQWWFQDFPDRVYQPQWGGG